MKRFLSFLFLLLLYELSDAGNVSVSRAGSVAQAFFEGASTKAADVRLKMVWDGGDSSTRSSEPPFYVFENESGGWVIISGNDACIPVLGYSESGSFKTEGMPSNVSAWFDGYKRQVACVRSRNVPADSSVLALWDNVASIRTATGKKMLNTRKWGQDIPYNNLCPTVDNQKSVTGCVCTAICEIMCYHKWPVRGNGTLPSYSYVTDRYRTRTQPGHELTSEYDWNAMPSSYRNYTSAQAANVARLMYDVGVMIKSAYNGADGRNTFGTAAYCEDVLAALVKYMDYDSSAVFVYRDDYSTARWSEMLRGEIYAGRPVLYGGNDSDGNGHEFVIDGCDANDMFYVNWGWDGDDNGWYAITSLRIDSDYDFRYNQDAFFGLQKNQGGGNASKAVLYAKRGNCGISLKSGSLSSGSFTMNVGNITNFGAFDTRFTFAFVLMDYADNVREVLCNQVSRNIKAYGETSFSVICTLTSPLRPGDKIVLCSRTADGDWKKVRLGNGCTGIDEYPAFEFPAIRVNALARYKAGDFIPLEVVNVITRPTSVRWYIDGKPYDDTEVVLPAGKYTIKCVATFGNRTETLVQQITVE